MRNDGRPARQRRQPLLGAIAGLGSPRSSGRVPRLQLAPLETRRPSTGEDQRMARLVEMASRNREPTAAGAHGPRRLSQARAVRIITACCLCSNLLAMIPERRLSRSVLTE